MKRRRRHRHGMACLVTGRGKLFCRRTWEAIKPLKKQRSCASKMVAEEMHDLKKRGRWKSRAQAIAVGLSRARRGCPIR